MTEEQQLYALIEAAKAADERARDFAEIVADEILRRGKPNRYNMHEENAYWYSREKAKRNAAWKKVHSFRREMKRIALAAQGRDAE